jgi:hypothetical protein
MVINYKEEVTRLDSFKPEDNSDFWKPKPGQYKLKALSELQEIDPFQKEGEEPKPRVQIEILCEDKKFKWTIGVGKSPASSYGQLCKLAIANNNKLTNTEFIVVVTFDGKKNSYTIVR